MLGTSGWFLVSVFVAAFIVCLVSEPRSLRVGIFLMLAIQGSVITLLNWELETVTRNSGVAAAGWTVLGISVLSAATVGLLGAFLVLNGVTMMRREGRGPAAVVSGSLGAAVLGYLALVLAAILPGNADLSLWVMLIGLPLFYLGFVFASFLAYSLLYGWCAGRFGRPVEATIALGSGLAGGERVTPLLAARLDRSVEVYERSRSAGRNTVIVASGGQGPGENLPEGEAMAGYLRGRGIDPGHLVAECHSRTTKENLELSAGLLRQRGINGPVAVVTNNFHAFRAALLMRQAGLQGYSVGSPTARYFWPSATVREFFAVLIAHRWLNLAFLAVLCVPMIARLFVVLAGTS